MTIQYKKDGYGLGYVRADVICDKCGDGLRGLPTSESEVAAKGIAILRASSAGYKFHGEGAICGKCIDGMVEAELAYAGKV
jgi:hypothetical protein